MATAGPWDLENPEGLRQIADYGRTANITAGVRLRPTRPQIDDGERKQAVTPEQLTLRLETTAELERLKLEVANSTIVGNIKYAMELEEKAKALQRDLDEMDRAIQSDSAKADGETTPGQ